jgi:rhodanese-related sulfurtransferase
MSCPPARPTGPGIPVPDFSCPAPEELPVSVLEQAGGEIPRISVGAYARLHRGEAAGALSAVHTVDCRSAYEYQAGHVVGAVNLTRYADMVALYARPASPTAAFAFLCEFSSVRGPRWARIFRGYDRHKHCVAYPALAHPHVYVGEGGFAAVAAHAPDIVVGRYRRMDDVAGDFALMKRAERVFAAETGAPRRAAARVLARLTAAPLLDEAEPFCLSAGPSARDLAKEPP